MPENGSYVTRLDVASSPFEGGRGWRPGDLIDICTAGGSILATARRVVLAVDRRPEWALYVAADVS